MFNRWFEDFISIVRSIDGPWNLETHAKGARIFEVSEFRPEFLTGFVLPYREGYR